CRHLRWPGAMSHACVGMRSAVQDRTSAVWVKIGMATQAWTMAPVFPLPLFNLRKSASICGSPLLLHSTRRPIALGRRRLLLVSSAAMAQPEIALLVSTYQRPRHLLRALESIALQDGVAGRMQVVVTDDGSTDETSQIVAEFAARVPFPVEFTTH